MGKSTGEKTVSEENPLPTKTIANLPPSKWFTAFGHWATGSQSMLRSFSLLRIIVGLGMLLLLTTSFKDRHYMWGVASTWIDPAVDTRGYPRFFNVFTKESALGFDAVYWVLILVVIVFIAGAYTRMVTPVLLVLWVGLSTNSVILTNGGDVVMRLTLFFALFANLSAHWSVDAWRTRGKTPSPGSARRQQLIPVELTNALHNSVLIVLMWQAVLIYVNSGIFKLRGSEWREGSALYYALNLDQFMVLPALSEIAWQITPFVYIGSFVGIWVQLFFPVMLLWKPTRYIGLALLMGMHAGIAIFFGLWPFSMAMVALDLLFIRDSSWEKAHVYLQTKVTALRGKSVAAG